MTATETNPEAVNPRMAGFNDRRKMGNGQFLALEDLRKLRILDDFSLANTDVLLGLFIERTRHREIVVLLELANGRARFAVDHAINPARIRVATAIVVSEPMMRNLR